MRLLHIICNILFQVKYYHESRLCEFRRHSVIADVNEVRHQAQLVYWWQTQVNIGITADLYYGGSLAF